MVKVCRNWSITVLLLFVGWLSRISEQLDIKQVSSFAKLEEYFDRLTLIDHEKLRFTRQVQDEMTPLDILTKGTYKSIVAYSNEKKPWQNNP